MKRMAIQAAILALAASAVAAEPVVHLGELEGGITVKGVRADNGQWGLFIENAGAASVIEQTPLRFEFSGNVPDWAACAAGYEALTNDGSACVGKGSVRVGANVRFDVIDRWTAQGNVLALDREVTVHGDAEEGFLSACTFTVAAPVEWGAVHWFVPGLIYGGAGHLTDVAIGGSKYMNAREFSVRIREDRLPAPLVGACFADGCSLAVLNPAPGAQTTAEEALDVNATRVMIDGRFGFGSVGGQEHDGRLSLGYWYPGTEGEVTYRGDTYPGGQLHAWRKRYHPIREGFRHRYRVQFRFGKKDAPGAFEQRAWRWAWEQLNPALTPHDIDAVRRSLTGMLAEHVIDAGNGTGIPNFINSQKREEVDERAVMGFCGANIDAAAALLYEASQDSTERGARLRSIGNAIIDSFIRLKMAPPEAEGFHLKTGAPVMAIGNDRVFLRSFADDVKRLLAAYAREKNAGRDHPQWARWCTEFADWLLTQQQPSGGFPRAWQPGTGTVLDASPQSSYNAVPLLVSMGKMTGESRYIEAAIRAMELVWDNGQSCGAYVGGTIDNPDVIDKEAGTLSLEACLALFEATQDHKWIERAAAAGDFAETWIYLWNVPMPADADAGGLHWKPGVPTTGVQLISSGHSLVDMFMTYNPGHYAKLAKYTGDPHYAAVARLLLHNTKNMLALPGRTYDLPGPGWQQEHWSMAPRRGIGLHRGWLPWVSTSHLNGIQTLEEFDPQVFRAMATAN